MEVGVSDSSVEATDGYASTRLSGLATVCGGSREVCPTCANLLEPRVRAEEDMRPMVMEEEIAKVVALLITE